VSVLIQLVADYAPWIYALCGLIALWYLREAFRYRRERKRAMYTLERESALGRVRNIFGVAFVLLAVMGLIYYGHGPHPHRLAASADSDSYPRGAHADADTDAHTAAETYSASH